MITKQFFETFPLYRKLEFLIPYHQTHLDALPRPAINMSCEQCKSIQTFNMINDYWELRAGSQMAAQRVEIWEIPLRCYYVCSACESYSYTFYVQFIQTDKLEKDTTYYKGFVRKVGQVPEWSIEIDRNLERALGKDADIYKKGLVSESQSYGIGSYAYFRRITENIIDELLDSITTLLDEKDKEGFRQALSKVKTTRVTEEKIELVQDLLPASLQPSGINPLKSLHSALSDGIHNKTDEECLELADAIKTILIYLLEEVRNRNDKAKMFTDKMKKLLSNKGKIS